MTLNSNTTIYIYIQAERRARELEAAELGDPNKWRERYSNDEVDRRKWQDAASLSWDGTTFILDPSKDPHGS